MDINADLGEGFLFDEELMQMISSCNIACGGHTGSENSMRATVRLAKKYNVTIGAHPSYPDPDHFGRKEMDIAPDFLKRAIDFQIRSLIRVAREEGEFVRYVKPHGALYNKAANDLDLAHLIVDVVKNIEPSVALMGLSGSLLEKVATDNHIMFIGESFADRRYNDDGTLVNRKETNAVIHTKEAAWQQIESLILNNGLQSVNHKFIEIHTKSICFHGDTPEAIELLSFVKEKLKVKGINISSAV